MNCSSNILSGIDLEEESSGHEQDSDEDIDLDWRDSDIEAFDFRNDSDITVSSKLDYLEVIERRLEQTLARTRRMRKEMNTGRKRKATKGKAAKGKAAKGKAATGKRKRLPMSDGDDEHEDYKRYRRGGGGGAGPSGGAGSGFAVC